MLFGKQLFTLHTISHKFLKESFSDHPSGEFFRMDDDESSWKEGRRRVSRKMEFCWPSLWLFTPFLRRTFSLSIFGRRPFNLFHGKFDLIHISFHIIRLIWFFLFYFFFWLENVSCFLIENVKDFSFFMIFFLSCV